MDDLTLLWQGFCVPAFWIIGLIVVLLSLCKLNNRPVERTISQEEIERRRKKERVAAAWRTYAKQQALDRMKHKHWKE
jgi:hypothetical protein